MSDGTVAPRDAVRPLLIVGATDLELAGIAAALDDGRSTSTAWGLDRRGTRAGVPVVVQALGVGKANTAAGLAIAIAELRPSAVLQIGIGGAYVGSFLSVGMAMLADEDVQLDLGLRRPEGWADWGALGLPLRPGTRDLLVADAVDRGVAPVRVVAVPADRALTDAIATATGLPRGRFATLDAVTHDVHVGAAMQAAFDVSVESMEGAAAAQTSRALGTPFAELRAVSNVVGERDKAHWDLRGAVRVARDVGLRALDALAADPRWGGAG